MNSTTITLFKDILKGVGRNPKEGRKKGGINAHTIIKASENVPCLIRYLEIHGCKVNMQFTDNQYPLVYYTQK